MNKTIVVRTSDPNKKQLKLFVKGPVERIATVKPASVYLYGVPGKKVESVVTITPAPKYPFSILDMKNLKGSGIESELVKPEKKGDPWQVRVSATAPKVSNLFDSITLTTDSKFKPVIRIRVSVMFVEEKKS